MPNFIEESTNLQYVLLTGKHTIMGENEYFATTGAFSIQPVLMSIACQHYVQVIHHERLWERAMLT